MCSHTWTIEVRLRKYILPQTSQMSYGDVSVLSHTQTVPWDPTATIIRPSIPIVQAMSSSASDIWTFAVFACVLLLFPSLHPVTGGGWSMRDLALGSSSSNLILVVSSATSSSSCGKGGGRRTGRFVTLSMQSVFESTLTKRTRGS